MTCPPFGVRALALAATTVLLLPACPKASGETNSDSDMSSTTPPQTTTTVDPTTTGTVPTTNNNATTSTGTSGGLTEVTSTTIPTPETDTGQCVDCIAVADEISCLNTPECRWSGVVSYTYSAQGCVGNIQNFCTTKMAAGVSTAMWRDFEGTQQVVEFAYTPECIGDEWKPCDCDGPLACLCTSVTMDCPERYDEFCAVNITELGCSNAQIKAEPICHYFKVAPEGPKDDKCEVKQASNKCLPATDPGKTTCKDDLAPLPPYPDANDQPACTGTPVPPLYWKEEDDIVKTIESCGPIPTGWTRCDSVDTPEQPDECKCNCN